jgi:fructoselysine-6-P-deglycase FrlB-like protein
VANLPLRPIEPDLVPTLERAVSQRPIADAIAAEVIARGIRTVYFVGMGGSWASSVPVTSQLQTSVPEIAVFNINAAEFSALYLPVIARNTLVVAASHSGGTPETVAAAVAAKERGALVVSVAIDDDNALSAPADFRLTYGSDRTITSAKYVLLSDLAYGLAAAFGHTDAAEAGRSALQGVPQLTLAATEKAEPALAAIAAELGAADNIYVLASGPLSGLAYLLSVCYFVEMQWKKSTHFTTGDFFHGPFELATDRMPYILFAGADATRAHAERAKTFFSTWDDNLHVLDAQELIAGVSDEERLAIQHIPMASITMRLADHFEATTGHSLDERRYMHKVAY